MWSESLDLSIFTPEIFSQRASQSGGKIMLSHQISTDDAFTSSNAKRQWQVRDIERLTGRNVQRTWSSPRIHGDLTWDVYLQSCTLPFPSSLLSRIYFHSFPFVGINSPTSKRVKSGNNGESSRVDRNGSSLLNKIFAWKFSGDKRKIDCENCSDWIMDLRKKTIAILKCHWKR